MAIFTFKKKGPFDQSIPLKLVTLPPILVPSPMLTLNTPEASVVALKRSVNITVPFATVCTKLVSTTMFLSLAGLEKPSLATAWKNIPEPVTCAFTCLLDNASTKTLNRTNAFLK